MPNTQETRPDDWPSFAVTGDKTRPTPDANIASGFPQSTTPPSRQEFNWAINQAFRGVRYMLQLGVPEWSATEPYPSQAKIQRGGLSFSAHTANMNVDPVLDATGTWERWGYTASQLTSFVSAALGSNFVTPAQLTAAIAAQQTVQDARTVAAVAAQQTVQDARTASAITVQQAVQDARTQTAITATIVQGGNVLAAPVSRFGVNLNDLAIFTTKGQVFSAQTTSFLGGNFGNRGSAIVPATTLSAVTLAFSGPEPFNSSWVDAATAVPYFLAYSGSGTAASVSVYKSDPVQGIQSKVIAASSIQPRGSANLVPLSNGNLAAAWSDTGAVFKLSIFDKNLNVLFGPLTPSTFSPGSGNLENVHAVALSGGGMAIAHAFNIAGAVRFGIYSNSGASVLADAVIPGILAGNIFPDVRVAQLANGNVVVAASQTTAGQPCVMFAIFSPTGAIVKAWGAGIANVSGSGITPPEISVVPDGFALLGQNTPTQMFARTFDNSGNPFGLQQVIASGGTPRLINDGVHHWVIAADAAGSTATTQFIRLANIGDASAILSTASGNISAQAVDIFYERDRFICAAPAPSTVFVFDINPDSSVSLAFSFTFSSGQLPRIRPVGDFAVSKCSVSGPGPQFQVLRYLDIAILGVAKQAVAPGNAGQVINMAVGPAAMTINPLIGAPSVTFDNSGGVIGGNRGVLLQNSIAMKGF